MAAKSNGRGDYQFHAAALNSKCRERLHLEGQLRKALDRQELVLQYQPKVEIGTGRVAGAEALMRWQHPELGLVQPNRFIPIAEDSGLIVPMGAWALEKACWQSQSLQGLGSEPIVMAVNVSASQFRHGNLMSDVKAAIETSHMDPRLLTLELTETLIMENPDETARILNELKAFGVTISIDDFGTGFSSLSTLKRFPIDELKIDMSFVKGIPHDTDDSAIVCAIIAMGHTLGLKLVAEGVETEEQLAFLEEHCCDQYQGFLFSRAVQPEDWQALLEQQS
jgi:EAL domain-containing protein (putative c-di-GMP-specific phosphodiesterase class I)